MKHRLRLPVVALTLILALQTTAPLTLACGPFSLAAIFVFSVHPEYPLSNFARGNLGVIEPTYARSYLFVAYRHLSGSGFNEKEQKALTELWKDRLDYTWELGEQEWIKDWNSARGRVPGLAAPGQIDVYRHREKPNEYETFLNCQKDAFATAAITLEARIKKFGAESGVIRDWVEAQDEVFANCSDGQHIPKAANMLDQLIRSDRDYQIAAANFYAGNFDIAVEQFAAISADPASPWRENAPYLAARALVRKASLGTPEIKQASLTQAEMQLDKIISDPKLATSRTAAERLLSVVRLRLHPEIRLKELAQSLMTRSRDEALKQDLWDYTVLLDQFFGADETDKKDAPSRAILVEDLTDWITTFASTGGPEPLAHSLSKWQETDSIRWLVAVLSKIDARHEKAADVMAAATRVTPESAAYPTILFHLVRLDVEAGRANEARRRIDESVAKHRSSLDASSLNLLLNVRMALAENLEDFLTYAQLRPAAFSWNDDGREIPADLKELQESQRALDGKKLFDLDAARILNEKMPLSVLKQAAESKKLPVHLRRDLVQATWLRAVLLSDYGTAAELVPALESLVPGIAPLVEGFTTASQPDEKRFAGLYTWLKFPGLEPVVDAGIGRETPLSEQDPYRDNWWCSSAFTPATNLDGQDNQSKGLLYHIDPNASPAFLTPAQVTAAAKEHSMLTALGAAPNYLSRQVVQWATKNPDDPRVPEALHLAVKSTRYGCTNKETGRWSKAAYDLLHRRYPKSTWAKLTPYWFKD